MFRSMVDFQVWENIKSGRIKIINKVNNFGEYIIAPP
jgi:hypothetical protein